LIWFEAEPSLNPFPILPRRPGRTIHAGILLSTLPDGIPNWVYALVASSLSDETMLGEEIVKAVMPAL